VKKERRSVTFKEEGEKMEEIETKGIIETLKEVKKGYNEKREEWIKKEKVWKARIRILEDKI